MQIKHLILGACIGLFGLVAPRESQAACSRADLDGTWQIYSFFVSGGAAGWDRCTVRISSGNIRSGTGCSERLAGGGSRTPKVKGGSLSIGSNCKIRGNIRIGNCRNTISEAWLARDKFTLAGVGVDCDNGIFQFNGVKR